ncbi:hypothetical protein C9975_05380 [Thalassospira xiamenensis]|nr:hypothetical protein C9975_05380 [Thalassospira xiamenensis]
MTKVQWRVLPNKANQAMELAGADAAREYLERTGSNSLFAIYEAMTAAAPAAPGGADLSEQMPLMRSVYNDIAEVNGINAWCVCCREHVEDDGIITHDPSCAFCALEMALSASATPNATVERDERAAFEAAWSKLHKHEGKSPFMRIEPLGNYRWGDVHEGWLMWQARAALENKP